eukprot:gene7159-14575_t
MEFSKFSLSSYVQGHEHIKIVDYFPFNGEPMAFFRMQYLKDVVDLFILTESNITHSGKLKPKYYVDEYNEWFDPFIKSGKLKIIKLDFPNEIYSNQIQKQKLIQFQTQSWAREMYQRDIGRNISLTAMGTSAFILLVSDADELPRKELIQNLRESYVNTSQPIGFLMGFFYYSFRWTAKGQWTGTYAINDQTLRHSNISLEDMRKMDRKKKIPNGGWHCSFCMDAKTIMRKLDSFAHTEYNSTRYQNEVWINHCRTTGTDLFHRQRLNKLPYKGQFGYPDCSNNDGSGVGGGGGDVCRSIPGYNILELPF